MFLLYIYIYIYIYIKMQYINKSIARKALCILTLGHTNVFYAQSHRTWSISTASSAGRYTGSYRIPVFIFLTIWIFKIPQYRCHLNNVWNATLLERGLFSLLHFGEDTAVCVTKRESSETEALVEYDERSHPQYPHRPHQISTIRCISSRVSHKLKFSVDATDSLNCRVPAFLNSLFIILRP